MLLKIYTNIDTLEIISGIDAAKFFKNPIEFSTWRGAIDAAKSLPLPPTGDFLIEPEIYDEWHNQENTENNFRAYCIDYLKDKYWVRVIIGHFAYYCTDEGKTIEKVGSA